MSAALLSVESLDVRYGAFQAVADVSLQVVEGGIIGVIGPNGAGKSTVVNAIAGVVRQKAGTVEFDGRSLDGLRPDQRAHLGIARTFQNLEVFPTMTVLENVMTRVEASRGHDRDTGAERERVCLETIATLGLERYANTEVGHLAYPERKLVEFARAIVVDARLLLLDEPTAGLAIEERRQVVETIVAQMRERQIAGLVIEHDMSVVRAMCDKVYVMDAGRCIAEGSYEAVASDRNVQEAYLGPQDD